jgi:2-iminobutanoate/2-iminopropanoate deaminase
MKKIIATDMAPAALGPYSQAVISGDFLFISGQLPINPLTGTLIDGDIAGRTHQVMANIKTIVEAAGGELSDIVKTTIFLTDLRDFHVVNEAYGHYFPTAPPARSTIQVAALPLGSNIEIETIFNLRK